MCSDELLKEIENLRLELNKYASWCLWCPAALELSRQLDRLICLYHLYGNEAV